MDTHICERGVVWTECPRFLDHVRDRVTQAWTAKIIAEGLDDESHEDRVLNGDPSAIPPRGVLRA